MAGFRAARAVWNPMLRVRLLSKLGSLAVPMFLALALKPCAQSLSPGPFKPPTSKAEEIRKFHTPPVAGMPAAARMAGYERRLRMEREGVFSRLLWRSVGPEIQGGRVVDIEWSPGTPDRIYVAFATGGLWVSEDAGVSWKPIFDQESSFAIGDVAISRDGKTIWLGAGENNNQRTSYSGTGVFKSTDAGKTWKNMGLHEAHRIGRVLIHPKNENTLYVAVIGHLYSQHTDRGVYKTTDGGATWEHVLKLDEFTGCIDLAMDSRNPETLIACAYDRDRRAWNFRESGPGSAVYRTENGGRSWNKIESLPHGVGLGRGGVASAPSKPGVFYVFLESQAPDSDVYTRDEGTPSGELTLYRFTRLTEEMVLQLEKRSFEAFVTRYFPEGTKADDVLSKVRSKEWKMADLFAQMEKRSERVFQLDTGDSEVFRSDDAGKTWRKIHQHRLGDFMGYYAGRVFVNPTDPDDLYITGLLMIRSKDGGKTWTQTFRGVHVDMHAHWIDPRNPKHQLNGNDGGLYESFDEGQTWRHLNTMSVGQFTTIAVDNKIPYNIFGGLQDNGTLKGPSNYVPGRSAPYQWTRVGGGDGSAVAVDPRDNDVIYVASQFGAHSGLNQKTNERWNARPSLRGEQLRFNWVSPFIISPHHPDIVYCGANRLFRSLNMGRNWEAISPDLTTKRENGDVPFSTIKDVSESPFKFGVIYVGTDDGLVWITKDHGSDWEQINTPSKGKWVSRVVASKWDAATVLVAQNGYRDDDFAPYLWKSTDYGKTWKSIVGSGSSGLPEEPINVVREDPNKKGILYVGTDLGVFVSLDDGTTWEPLQGGIPRTPVHDLAVHPRDNEMAIASHARSVWVLDVKPIQDLTDEIRNKEIHVWQVDSMRRDRRWGHQAKNAWDRTLPTSPRLRVKAWLKKGGKGKLALKDKEGKVIKEVEIDAANGYNWFEIDLELKPGKPILDDPAPRNLKTLEDVLKDPYEDRRPVYLPAGEYKVEIVVGSAKAEVSWRISE